METNSIYLESGSCEPQCVMPHLVNPRQGNQQQRGPHDPICLDLCGPTSTAAAAEGRCPGLSLKDLTETVRVRECVHAQIVVSRALVQFFSGQPGDSWESRMNETAMQHLPVSDEKLLGRWAPFFWALKGNVAPGAGSAWELACFGAPGKIEAEAAGAPQRGEGRSAEEARQHATPAIQTPDHP